MFLTIYNLNKIIVRYIVMVKCFKLFFRNNDRHYRDLATIKCYV